MADVNILTNLQAKEGIPIDDIKWIFFYLEY